MPLLSRLAQKGLDRLTTADRLKALEIIASLDTDPSMGKRLQGRLSGCRSVPNLAGVSRFSRSAGAR